MEQMVTFLKEHYQYFFIVVGILYVLAAFFNIGEINKYSTADSGRRFKSFIFEHFGETGYKVLNIMIGIAFIFFGVLSLVYRS